MLRRLPLLIADGFSNALTRRGYATMSQSATREECKNPHRAPSISGKIAPKSGEDKVATSKKDSWVLDPVTGYSKPENTKEIDIAELRATIQDKNFNH
ncbi:indole-3-acetic acid-induced protein ARG2-like [Gastrolobium bilobum]|uniref:indole-3-acetic acid-induced protein ARG2-like n=1 Tax=Gastrolobium bilobum TaxID=150636 RepID=UPI002AB04967|nr:indole-3-acetic acid-induced protein ARG2-like [Gastrolobium bilobum]